MKKSISEVMGEPDTGEPLPGSLAAQEQEAIAADPLAEEQGTEAEQVNYEKIVLAASEILYDEKSSRGVTKMLKAGDDPARSIANVTVMIMTQLDEKSGGTIPEEVILPAATEVVELVAELGVAQKIFEVDEAMVNRAAQLMVVSMADEYNVEMEDIQGMMAGVDPTKFEPMRKQQDAYANPQPMEQEPV